MSQTFDPSADEFPEIPDVLPVLPLSELVVYPYIIVPLSLGDEASALAVDDALADSRVLLLSPLARGHTEVRNAEDLASVGTAALVMRMLKLPDGRVRILVQGLSRVRLAHLNQSSPFPRARIELLVDSPAEDELEVEALVRGVREQLERAVHLGKSISSEVMVIATNLSEPGRLADLAASNLELRLEDSRAILETLDPVARLRRVSELLQRELQLLTMQHEISSAARGEIDRTQREYFLRQQLKAIQEELGDGEELTEEIAGYRKRLAERRLSAEAEEEVERQLRRLERSPPDSVESSVIRSHLDWLTGLPWGITSEDRLDLAYAQQVLDEDHYDLERVKERILEYLAVRMLKPDARGAILCFVGPPGVGKTSLGRSIARALDRRFVRLALGGVRDEAEIRGHRRTYVGALPGRILQGLQQAGTDNPVFMLDEIDKVGADFRGDPSSALLEVLDPEQNHTFRDHYLGVDYDLSKVLFITTANLLDPIQPAFLDRMEVIRLSGYTPDEKVQIARRHLISKQIEQNGLSEDLVSITEPAIRRLLRDYTKEAGVRGLERELAALCRKVAIRVARGDKKSVRISTAHLERMLGPARHFSEELLDHDRIGVATGLAWTAAGGDLLLVEVELLPGKGKLLLTGHLGEVMRESAQTALSFARSFAATLGFAADYFNAHDVHVHVPAGSVPKDGPSAGITIATAIVSRLLELPIDRKVAMTGELTLRGEVMPIGGLREKLLAAVAAGGLKVVLPATNRRDLREAPVSARRRLELHFVSHVRDVLELAIPELRRRTANATSSSTQETPHARP